MYCVTPAGIQFCSDVGDGIKCNNTVVEDDSGGGGGGGSSDGTTGPFWTVMVRCATTPVVRCVTSDGVDHTNRNRYSVRGGGVATWRRDGRMEERGTGHRSYVVFILSNQVLTF